ncbi:MAG: D-arabinono-1,4-lactone oxidase [Segniliparus sp.]|uniref:D-arabinono-1,4-lactone oxidase n=1 Tax=Segniliparus sp. TaxID=2804064 RepID=UPI003F2F7A6E
MSDRLWQNWGRTQSARPSEIVRPLDTAQVCEVVANAARRGARVKAVGSGHSFSGIAVAPEILLDLGAMAGLVDADLRRCRVTVAAGTPLWQLSGLLAERGLAMANMGDIDRQTVAGAIATGTHGTGGAFGGLATQVVGLTLVTGSGETLRVDEAEHTELLLAARIGLGALGVLVDVTLQCVPAFQLRAQDQAEPLADVLDGFDERVASADHFEFYWFPHTQVALTRTNTRLPAGAPFTPPGRISRWARDEILNNAVFGAVCGAGSLVPAAVPSLNRAVARLAGSSVRVDRSDRVFVSPRRVRFREMEYAIPREAVLAAFARVRALLDGRGWRIGFPVEVRTAAADENWLSTAHGRESAYIAVHRHAREDPAECFAAVEQIMRDYDGRPHWGKMHNRTAADLRGSYPRFDDFLSARERLDPSRVFANDYLSTVLGD